MGMLTRISVINTQNCEEFKELLGATATIHRNVHVLHDKFSDTVTVTVQ